MAPDQALQVGEVARQAGVTVRTVRYYEEKGLLRAAPRTSGGMRLYETADVARLRFIVRLRALGLSLDEIAQALGPDEPHHTRPERVARTVELLLLQQEAVQEQLQATLARQREIEEALERVRACAHCSAPECPPTCENLPHLL